jgi:hypothetical protein
LGRYDRWHACNRSCHFIWDWILFISLSHYRVKISESVRVESKHLPIWHKASNFFFFFEIRPLGIRLAIQLQSQPKLTTEFQVVTQTAVRSKSKSHEAPVPWCLTRLTSNAQGLKFNRANVMIWVQITIQKKRNWQFVNKLHVERNILLRGNFYSKK